MIQCNFLVLFTALCISCYHCMSTTSWEDCEDNLGVVNCSSNLICATQMLEIFEDGKTIITHHFKLCEDPQKCNPKKCTKQNQSCEIKCCTQDFCNRENPFSTSKSSYITPDNTRNPFSTSKSSYITPDSYFVFSTLFVLFSSGLTL